MTTRNLRLAGCVAALALSAPIFAACGEDDEEPRAESKAPKLAPAAAIERSPEAISCGHVRDQQKWADTTRRATVAIANGARIRDLSGLQASQSIFYAMTELCKEQPAAYQPADAAVKAVRAGEYRADLGSP